MEIVRPVKLHYQRLRIILSHSYTTWMSYNNVLYFDHRDTGQQVILYLSQKDLVDLHCRLIECVPVGGASYLLSYELIKYSYSYLIEKFHNRFFDYPRVPTFRTARQADAFYDVKMLSYETWNRLMEFSQHYMDVKEY